MRVLMPTFCAPPKTEKKTYHDSANEEEWKGQTYVQVIVFARQLEGHPTPGGFTPRVQGLGYFFAGLCVKLKVVWHAPRLQVPLEATSDRKDTGVPRKA